MKNNKRNTLRVNRIPRSKSVKYPPNLIQHGSKIQSLMIRVQMIAILYAFQSKCENSLTRKILYTNEKGKKKKYGTERKEVSRESCYLNTPASPHIVVSPNWLTIAHESKIHSRSDELTVESKIHATHWEQSPFGDGKNSINIPAKREARNKSIIKTWQNFQSKARPQTQKYLAFFYIFLNFGHTSSFSREA